MSVLLKYLVDIFSILISLYLQKYFYPLWLYYYFALIFYNPSKFYVHHSAFHSSFPIIAYSNEFLEIEILDPAFQSHLEDFVVQVVWNMWKIRIIGKQHSIVNLGPLIHIFVFVLTSYIVSYFAKLLNFSML